MIQNYVEGQWRQSGASSHLAVMNPATAEELGRVPLCGAGEVEQAVQSARDKARRANVNVEFRIGNVLNDGIGGPYDILFDRGVYHGLRLDNLKGFQELLRRVTRPGSWWLSLAGNANEKRDGDGPPVVTEVQIRAELGLLFDIVELRECRFTTNQSGFRPLAWSILTRRK